VRKTRSVLWRFGAVSAALTVASIGFASVAGAWYEPANTQQSYWSPGPPPGSSSYNDCYVTTANGVAYNEAYAEQYLVYGYGSICGYSNFVVTTYDNGYITAGSQGHGTENTWAYSWGVSGTSVYAANYATYNIYAVPATWEASWRG
jgi:hypothetical protein